MPQPSDDPATGGPAAESGRAAELRAGGRDGGQASARRKAANVDIDESAGQRIDNFLLRILKDVPKSRVYRMLRRGEVRVNGGRKNPTYRLAAGDTVRIPPHHVAERPERFIGSRRLQQLEEAIIYEDAELLVLNKPAGIAVHGGSGLSYGVIEGLRELRGAQLELAHRLDRDTSGCLLLAKKRSALRRVHASIRDGSLIKNYVLIVEGRWPAGLTSVRLPLRKYHTDSGERRVRVAEGGKPSRTEFEILVAHSRASLLSARLVTGRTHQIRVHAAASEHPIVGDTKYNRDGAELAERLGIRRLCLHAEEVHLPWEGGEKRFAATRPADFTTAWERLSQPAGDSAPSTS